MELGGLLWTSVLKLALTPQRHSPDAWLQHQEPVIYTAQNKREEKKEEERRETGGDSSCVESQKGHALADL